MRYSFRKLDTVKFGNLFQFSKKSKPQNFAAVKFNFKSVRVEDGTLTEITDLLLEMLQGGDYPTADLSFWGPAGVCYIKGAVGTSSNGSLAPKS